MATFLRPLSYKYQWLYDTISRLAALPVGGEKKFRQLALKNLNVGRDSKILDLCCGAGQTTKFLVQCSDNVIGLDISPHAIEKAKKNVPQAKYVVAAAQKMPFPDNEFDIAHTSVALHEMTSAELEEVFKEVYRVLKPGGLFTFIDLHKPHNPLFLPGIMVFMWLFETETAWQLLETDLPTLLTSTGFINVEKQLFAGGSLQVIRARKPECLYTLYFKNI
ncbi:MAG: methyltransferase domain-containing protein [Geminocystis sp.]|nr:methyltransferase domain-containing protein [Geminocystis sp.]HIK36958.1 methyltransferase domain-containing protein [Geminocystis sp. M7585_C2015_104]MCS7148142.1 methyltransferase domain-containing protein [Geminocystis sp.]MCX8078095.1 methyltransferase domain-containing protein [Geminocystis sp.]MDW8116493.1 methyltransferase domain-containing protein [Geminocystis sp.]